MTLPTLDWSAPAVGAFATIQAKDGTDTWRIVPVPGDVVRIDYNGVDPDGSIVECRHDFAYAESVEEAKILIDVMRTGYDALPDWKTQIEAAGFVRTYPEADENDVLSCLWNDDRETDLFQITVMDEYVRPGQAAETSVHSTYEEEGAPFWHNVSRVNSFVESKATYGDLTIRNGKPACVDTLRTGVAGALAIRAARTARGDAFGMPIGGAPKRERKPRAKIAQRVR